MSTEILQLRVWTENTLQNNIPANDNSLRLEALLRPCLGIENEPDVTDPPYYMDGDVWIVGDTPAGVFATFNENDIAIHRLGNWYAWQPVTGLRTVVAGVRKVFDGAAWIDDPSIGGGAVDSVNGQTGTVVLDATDLDYDNSGSGLAATDVQGAIDEIAAGGGGGGSYECRWLEFTTGSNATPVISNQGLTIMSTVAGIAGQNKATIARSAGKRYFEITVDSMGGSGTPTIGVSQMAASGQVGESNVVSTARTASWGLMANSGDKYFGSVSSYGSALSASDVVMVAVDLGSGKIWWGKNGTWFASGNPGAGTGAAFSSVVDWVYPSVSSGSGSKVTANFGGSAFAYTPPSGFSAWDS